MTPARHLLALAEEELALIRADRIEDLAALHVRRERVMAVLPAVLDADDRAALMRAAGTQDRVTEALSERMDVVRSSLRNVTRGRAAARGYAPAGVDAPALSFSA